MLIFHITFDLFCRTIYNSKMITKLDISISLIFSFLLFLTLKFSQNIITPKEDILKNCSDTNTFTNFSSNCQL